MGSRSPLYTRLQDHLRALVADGRLSPHERVPSERELSERFGVSRMTARHALSQLVAEGVLYRRRGAGTFVAEPKIRQGLLTLTGFTEDMLARGLRPGARVLDLGVHAAPPEVAAALEIAAGEPVVRIERLRLADDQPMALERSHLPAGRFPGLERHSLHDRSLYRVLAEEYGLVLRSARQTLEPAAAGRREADALQIKRGALLLLLERTTYDDAGRPIEFVRSLYRGDRYKFEVELVRRALAAAR